MAYVGVTNLSASQGGGADMLYAIYGAMVSASWSCLGSGKGAAGGYSSSGSLITSAATFNSNGAWVRMREPSGAGGREYILMRGASALNAVIKYSRSTGFAGGTPNSASCPTTGTGGDGRVIVGSGTDTTATIAASGSALLDNATGYVHCVASDTAMNGVYGFWAMKTGLINGTLGSFFCQEGVQVGSTNAADQDPSWRAVAGTAAEASSWWAAGGTCSWWEKYNLTGSAYRTAGHLFPPQLIDSGGLSANSFNGNAGVIPFSSFEMGQDPYESGKTTFITVMLSKYIGIGTACIWPKGYTTGIQIGTTAQTLLDVFNYSSSEPRIVINTTIPLVMPWITNVTPLV